MENKDKVNETPAQEVAASQEDLKKSKSSGFTEDQELAFLESGEPCGFPKEKN